MALLGRREDALAELRKVRSLDLGPGGHMTEEAVFYQLRDFPKLTETAKQGIAVNPNEWLEHYMLGIGYEGIGKLTEAIVEYKKAVELSDGDHDATASLAHAYAASGDKLAAMKILHEWEAPTAKTARSPYLLATIYAGLGQKDRAFAYLNQALRERNLDLPFHFRADPRIDSLRSDSRLQTLVSQIGFPIQR
jgi:tetratricopeptide (TPR) repeat protein